MRSTIDEFLLSLETKDIKVWVEDGNLKLRAPKGVLTPELRAAISERKEEIIKFYESMNFSSVGEQTINPTSRPERIPLSFTQQRTWFNHRMEEQATAFNIPLSWRIEGDLDIALLEKCLSEIIKRHETLRTIFPVAEDIPVQQILDPIDVKIKYIDITDLKADKNEAVLRKMVNDFTKKIPIDITKDLLLRSQLLKLEENLFVFTIVAHHIVYDYWSIGNLLKEFNILYEALHENKEAALPVLKIQYADFTLWQRDYLKGTVLDKLSHYWTQQLEGIPLVTELPMDRPRPKLQTVNHVGYQFDFTSDLLLNLKTLNQETGATMYMTLLAAFFLLLYRYTSQDDICIGSPTSSRKYKELENLIGDFINTIIIRSTFDNKLTFIDLVQKIRKTSLEAYTNQDMPIDKIVELINPPRDLSHSPLYQVVFIYQNIPKFKLKIPDNNVTQIFYDGVTAAAMTADIALRIEEENDQTFAVFEYNQDLFDKETIIRLSRHYINLLSDIVINPRQGILEFSFLTADEKHKILDEWNDTKKVYRQKVCMHELIAEQAAKSPEHIACIFEDEALTYDTLNKKANQLAHYLRQLGIGRDQFVGVCAYRSMEMVISLLGIIKAGAAYVPLDPFYPKDRLNFLIEDSQVKVILTHDSLLNDLAQNQARKISFEDLKELAGHMPDTNPVNQNEEDDAAYMIYTSGSTGVPKGVVNIHKALCNRLFWMQDVYRLGGEDRVLQKTPYSFDVSVWEFFWPLMTGAALVVAKPEGHKDSAYLCRIIADKMITVLHFVPSMLQIFLNETGVSNCVSLKKVICSGEALSYPLKETFFDKLKNIELHNLYGPTEAAIDVTSFACYPDPVNPVVPIGKPIANIKMYILDELMKPVPVGVKGELYIGGVGLARGYWNRPELTMSRFIPDPISGEPDSRLYRTGDLARYRADGNIEYLGRTDFQVKIRGFRIELGEIENALLNYQGVNQAVVTAHTDAAGSKRLIAYIAPQENDIINIDELKAYLTKGLPEYMVPSFFILLDSIPLNSNGKVDRKKLPEPDMSAIMKGKEIVAPENESEAALLSIWQEVLRIKELGVNHNFFESGGHSLLSTQVVSRIREVMGIIVPIRLIFECPTVRQLAKYLGENEKEIKTQQTPQIKRVERTGKLPLSFAQERLWFLDQLGGGSVEYNLPVALRFEGELDSRALEESLKAIVKRHESLRTRFEIIEGVAYQLIEEDVRLPIKRIDIRELSEKERETKIREFLLEEGRRPFNLKKGSLIRVALFHVKTDEHILLMNIHHIVFDAWSVAVFVKELSRLYEYHVNGGTYPCNEPELQYADFAFWQREWLQGEIYQKQLDYWKKSLNGAPALLELPKDKPRPAIKSAKGKFYHSEIGEELTSKLNAFSQESGATLYMTLLGGFAVLLSRYSNQDDVVVGTPIANRNHPELEELIGFFVNTLALRLKLQGEICFKEFIKLVKQTCLDGYSNQDLPFEKLVEALKPERDPGYTPIFQVMFVLQNAPLEVLSLPGVKVGHMEVENETAKFDLTLMVEERGGRLYCTWEYSSDLFEEATLTRMMNHYALLLAGLIAEREKSVFLLPLITKEEENQLTNIFNDTEKPFPEQKCVVKVFEDEVDRRKKKTALRLEEESLTYEALNRGANQLGWHLKRLGLKKGEMVGLCLGRSMETVIGILGILKGGGAYVPLDPVYPEERLGFMIDDTKMSFVITEKRYENVFKRYTGKLLLIEEEKEQISGESERNIGEYVAGDALCYVMYTSGSTGTPKGVCVTHKNVLRLVKGADYADFESGNEVFLQYAPVSFDASTFEIWASLLNGNVLEIMPPGLWSLEELGTYIYEKGITILWLTAGLFHLMVEKEIDKLRGVRQLLAGGDTLSVSHVKKVMHELPGRRMINGYGPTEGTTFSCCYTVKPEDACHFGIPIGYPISNTRVYILDERRELVPIGVAGEIYIGGEGIADGYLNQRELTDEKFVNDWFKGEGKLYKSGDLGRWLEDGRIEFLGRKDFQVKLRGFRIELGEIETALREHPEVEDAVVIAQEESKAEKRLVAYVVSKSAEHKKVIEEVKELIHKKLPEYMMPSFFIVMESFPLNANGKIDRKKLPEPDMSKIMADKAIIAPENETEAVLLSIWKDVLNFRELGVNHNFFESGGHSLLSTQVVSRMNEVMRVKIPIRVIFECPTVREIARYIAENNLENKETRQQIQHVERTENLPLSFAQERLWFLDQLEGGSVEYNVPVTLRFEGALDNRALVESLQAIVRRHESLRTRFETISGVAYQCIEEDAGLPIQHIDLREFNEEEREAKVKTILFEEGRNTFDLRRGPLMRAVLLYLTPQEHILMLNIHHIIFDAWSVAVFIKELSQLYEYHVNGGVYPLTEPEFHYADFAYWQREWLNGEFYESQLNFWRKSLADTPTLLNLPKDKQRPAVKSSKGKLFHAVIGEKLTAALNAFSQELGATMYMSLLGGFVVLLSRYSNQEDLVVGSPIANRNHHELEEMIGFFVNTLALRFKLREEMNFKEFMEVVKQTCIEGYGNQDLPFEKLVETLRPERDPGYTPIFQVMFVLQNAPLEELILPGVKVNFIEVENETAKFDLTLMIDERGGKLYCTWEYSTDLFEKATIKRMMGHYELLLEGLMAHREESVFRVPMLHKEEENQLINGFNNTEKPFPENKCIVKLFEEEVKRREKKVAVRLEAESLTYEELNKGANQLGHYLKRLGLSRGEMVGLCLDRSTETIKGILGILKAGGAYVPLDPEYPEDRLNYMIEDTKMSFVIAAKKYESFFRHYRGKLLLIEEEREQIGSESERNIEEYVAGDALCYVMYTSGSTGTPKGVCVTHKNVLRLVKGADYADFESGNEIFLQYAPVSFDASTFEIWASLLNGNILEIMPPGKWSLEELGLYIYEKDITILWLTAGLFHLMVEKEIDKLRRVRQLLAGGDTLSVSHVKKVMNELPECRMINGYGPTEGTTFSCCYTVKPEDDCHFGIPIGYPISNTMVYILDERRELVPIGVAGELYIGGEGIADGYLNQRELTDEKFVKDWFRGEGKLYHSGDLGRWLEDGRIEFLGRKDFQVKLRGFRIELGEIETALHEHPEVEDAVVIAKEESKAEKRLIAYLVTKSVEHKKVIEEVKELIHKKLPEYMMPSFFIVMESLPLNANGKIDRKKLPEPDISKVMADKEVIAPENETEATLLAIWQEVLKVRELGVNHNFFESGGHSLLSTQVVSRIKEVMGVKIPIRVIFERPTVREIAIYITENNFENKEAHQQIRRIERTEILPLSFAQERLWFLDQLDGGSIEYNVPITLRFEGVLDIRALEESMYAIVLRHESLRTRFEANEGVAFQYIEEDARLSINHIDLRELSEKERETKVRAILIEEGRNPFDLRRGPLLRATLLYLKPTEHILLFNIHHIIFDGWSVTVFINELSKLYEYHVKGGPYPLSTPDLQYADFAVWQREWLNGELYQKQLDYWRKNLAGAPALIELPKDKPRPVVKRSKGKLFRATIGEKLTTNLNAFSQELGATLYMSLLGGFVVLLSRYCNQEDLVVGSPIANRNHKELEGMIGFFVNTLALRFKLREDITFQEFMEIVKQTCIEGYSNQDLPFEKLVETLKPERDPGFTPIIQVMFALLNAPLEELSLPGVKVSFKEVENETAKFDLTLTVEERSGQLYCFWEYSTDLFEEATIKRMMGHYELLLAGLIADKEKNVYRIPMISKEEENLIINSFNDTARPFPEDKSIVEIFEEEVGKHRKKIALNLVERSLTYEELNKEANKLGHYLKRFGVRRGEMIGLCLDRSIEMIVGILGILKSGGAYVPLDPEYPEERLNLMIEDTKMPLVITEEKYKNVFKHYQGNLLLIEEERARIAGEIENNVGEYVNSDSLCYVMYTSGSTGKPKGVCITHKNVVKLVKGVDYADFESGREVFLQNATICFDASTFEVWASLLNGNRLEIMPPGKWSMEELGSYIHEKGITILLLTTGLFHLLVEQEIGKLSRLKQFLAGGDALSVNHVKKVLKELPECRMINGYGPTEGTTFASCYTANSEEPYNFGIPIGYPIANTQIYILDKQQNIVPVGVIGELYIGGEGVADGYLNRRELTAEKFVADWVRGEGKLYRSGDLGRWLEDGRIEFFGRKDFQVKIRGFRVELGEIESVLLTHHQVSEALCLVKDDYTGNKTIVAYYIPSSGFTELKEELRKFCKEKLPEYMVPSYFIELEYFPLTSNGKIDRHAFPDPEFLNGKKKKESAPPRDQTEFVLLQIWEEILRNKSLGIKDNFFEVGGNSLLSVSLIYKIQKAFNKRIPVSSLFQFSTVEELAKLIRETSSKLDTFSPIVPLKNHGDKKPLVFLHPAGGNVFCYYPLIQMLDQNAWGIQAFGLDENTEPKNDIHKMARSYIDSLQTLDPTGPYYLAGFSIGGVFAYEMAAQLTEMGKEVALLSLIDTYPPSIFDFSIDERQRLIFFLNDFIGFTQTDIITICEDLNDIPTEEMIDYFIKNAKQHQILPDDIKSDFVKRSYEVYKGMMEGLRDYKVPEYKGKLHLFIARDNPARTQLNQELLGWKDYAPDITAFELSGSHYDVFREENKRKIHDLIKNSQL